MKIDMMNMIYTVSMIILAFVSAIVVTKSISKWLKLDEKTEDDDA